MLHVNHLPKKENKKNHEEIEKENRNSFASLRRWQPLQTNKRCEDVELIQEKTIGEHKIMEYIKCMCYFHTLHQHQHQLLPDRADSSSESPLIEQSPAAFARFSKRERLLVRVDSGDSEDWSLLLVSLFATARPAHGAEISVTTSLNAATAASNDS